MATEGNYREIDNRKKSVGFNAIAEERTYETSGEFRGSEDSGSGPSVEVQQDMKRSGHNAGQNDFTISWGGTHHSKVVSMHGGSAASGSMRSSNRGFQTSMGMNDSGWGMRSAVFKRSTATGKVSRLRRGSLEGPSPAGGAIPPSMGTAGVKMSTPGDGAGPVPMNSMHAQSSAWTKSWLQSSVHGNVFNMTNTQTQGVTVSTVDFGDEETFPEPGDDLSVLIHKAYYNRATLGVSAFDCNTMIFENVVWNWVSGSDDSENDASGSAVPLTIPGIDIGVSMMSLGECATILIPPEYGYTKGKIKGKPLFFEVEILRINDFEIMREEGCCCFQ